MYRSCIPKPHKPGEMRPIRQPHKADIIVMDTAFEHRFWRHLSNALPWVSKRERSHPLFRSCSKQKLGKVDRLIQADIVGYFMNINIHIFISTLSAHIGQGNDAFCNLIEASDQNRKSYAFFFKGIQRVSPLSPVLLNIFLQKHIMLIHILSQKKEFIVVIYADNFVFAIKKGPESERVSQSFQQMLKEPSSNSFFF